MEGVTMRNALNCDKMMKNLRKVQSFAFLEKDWNGYDSDSIPITLIKKVESLLQKGLLCQPDVFPCGDGSIQFEWEDKTGRYLEIDFYNDKDTANVFFMGSDEKVCHFDGLYYANALSDVINFEDISEINEWIATFLGVFPTPVIYANRVRHSKHVKEEVV